MVRVSMRSPSNRDTVATVRAVVIGPPSEVRANAEQVRATPRRSRTDPDARLSARRERKGDRSNPADPSLTGSRPGC